MPQGQGGLLSTLIRPVDPLRIGLSRPMDTTPPLNVVIIKQLR